MCLSVSRITQRLSTNVDDIPGGVRFVTSNSRLDSGGDPDHDAIQEFLKGIFIIVGYWQIDECCL